MRGYDNNCVKLIDLPVIELFERVMIRLRIDSKVPLPSLRTSWHFPEYIKDSRRVCSTAVWKQKVNRTVLCYRVDMQKKLQTVHKILKYFMT